MKSRIFLAVFLFVPAVLFAQINPAARHMEMDKALNTMETKMLTAQAAPNAVRQPTGSFFKDLFKGTPDRQSVISEVLRNIEIEMSLEQFVGHGEQIFEVVDDGGSRISKLLYPQRGNMFKGNAELRLHPRFSVGAGLGSSRFKHTVATDTDWLPSILPDVWWESNSSCKAQVDTFNVDLYFRLLDLKDVAITKDMREYFSLETVDEITFDIFTGYEKFKGRYRMTDGKDTVEWWVPVTDGAFDGLDSFYKVQYEGPRLGLRAGMKVNKWISTRFAFTYAWLRTKAYGWWNLRDYQFWQDGKTGQGLTYHLEFLLHFTPHWYVGAGYFYSSHKQRSMTESGREGADRYYDLDIIRNVNNRLYGPTFKVGCNW